MSAFRRRNAAVVAARHFGPNMTPMVDIVMVILIFFMAGSAFIGPEWFLDVGMAAGTRAAPPEDAPTPSMELPPARMVVRLHAGPGGATVATGLGLEGAPLEALEARVREYVRAGGADRIRLVVEPARNTPYQDVIRVYNLCLTSGAPDVSLAKSREPAP
ncbi:MAG: biopolymer transporter ExbD [Phycisphaerales bacterium]|nr:biopolymer transporter ExbD [Phycisphaerales bacterium]